MKQYEQVIDVMRKNGGYATLGFLNQAVDVSKWSTKTPFASIRRIVQDEHLFFKIKPGLWALRELESEVLAKLNLSVVNKTDKQEIFSHAYYQGLLLELGHLKGFSTYIPSQDKNKKFLEIPLSEISDTSTIYSFSYPEIVNRAKTVDVIWFNDRNMPSSFFEVEHTTDIQNSLLKYYDLQDFYAHFYIVSSIERKSEFDSKISYHAFKPIKQRVQFIDYEFISNLHTKSFELKSLGEI